MNLEDHFGDIIRKARQASDIPLEVAAAAAGLSEAEQIDPDDAVLLLIDHQSGLFQLVRDIELPTLRAHVTALAKVARLAKVPTFTTASVPDGPNGPLIPEIHQSNPDAVYIPRTGQINAWDNPAWVKAIKATKRKTLLLAGTLTSVCMAFPTLSALAAGYKVFAIVDASGNWSKMATDLTIARVAQAGARPIDTNGDSDSTAATKENGELSVPQVCSWCSIPTLASKSLADTNG